VRPGGFVSPMREAVVHDCADSVCGSETGCSGARRRRWRRPWSEAVREVPRLSSVHGRPYTYTCTYTASGPEHTPQLPRRRVRVPKEDLLACVYLDDLIHQTANSTRTGSGSGDRGCAEDCGGQTPTTWRRGDRPELRGRQNGGLCIAFAGRPIYLGAVQQGRRPFAEVADAPTRTRAPLSRNGCRPKPSRSRFRVRVRVWLRTRLGLGVSSSAVYLGASDESGSRGGALPQEPR